MTNSTHKHKWRFFRNAYFGALYAGTLRIRGVWRCSCGKLKYGQRSGPAPHEIEDYDDWEG